jgi:hypothetical protein
LIPVLLPDPLQVDRGTARGAARNELQKRIYHQHDEPLALRALNWVLDRLDHALSRASDFSPGGTTGLVLIVIAVLVLLVVLRWRLGPLGRAARAPAALFDDTALDADDYRARADARASAGDYAEAVRERLRAIVRELEQRGVLEPRLGRTADEAAREAGVVLISLATPLREGAQLFDEIWYGGRAADAAADARLRELDRSVQSVRVPLEVS